MGGFETSYRKRDLLFDSHKPRRNGVGICGGGFERALQLGYSRRGSSVGRGLLCHGFIQIGFQASHSAVVLGVNISRELLERLYGLESRVVFRNELEGEGKKVHRGRKPFDDAIS